MIPPIKGFIENSLIEWEGQIAAVLFLPGCNLRCRYCHAGHLLDDPDPTESIPLEAVLESVARQRGWVDGVVVSGGEPTLHEPGLQLLVRSLKSIPTRVWLETNGTRPGALQKLIFAGLLDGVAMDLKATLRAHELRRITRSEVDPAALRQSIRLILNRVPDHEFKITLVPGFITADDVEELARTVQGARRLALQNFRPVACLDPALHEVEPFAPDEVNEMACRAEPYVDEVIVRGLRRVGGPVRVS
jgi:pyruvate formate lyase activating enzyme